MDVQVREKWSEYNFVGEDGTNHGRYKCVDCLWAVLHVCEDGYKHCPIIWSGSGNCEECMRIVKERRAYEKELKKNGIQMELKI